MVVVMMARNYADNLIRNTSRLKATALESIRFAIVAVRSAQFAAFSQAKAIEAYDFC